MVHLLRTVEDRSFTERKPLFCRNVLITFAQLHIHTWKLPSTTIVWTAGLWAAPLERLGLRALLKGISVLVMREGQAAFSFSPPRFIQLAFLTFNLTFTFTHFRTFMLEGCGKKTGLCMYNFLYLYTPVLLFSSSLLKISHTVRDFSWRSTELHR